MTEVYVYYKLRAKDADAARAAFAEARGAASVRLLQRDEGSELLTWMEIYAPYLQAVEMRIAEAVAPFIEGTRHHEHFRELT